MGVAPENLLEFILHLGVIYRLFYNFRKDLECHPEKPLRILVYFIGYLPSFMPGWGSECYLGKFVRIFFCILSVAIIFRKGFHIVPTPENL